ncbi:IQ domain-containing protein H-like isoform X1 [Branchiostoma lanceolatum]|uniref:IQ domain-containing protein H-like isoform X1 n=1 Tax=Branchiostoma lanceolatum TaxID=7740 RepID=UPI00345270B7
MQAAAMMERRPEEVGEILVKVQEDLRQLRDRLVHQVGHGEGQYAEVIDLKALENAIERTEVGVKGRTHDVLRMINNKVQTLPAVDFTGATPQPRYPEMAPYEQYDPRLGGQSQLIIRPPKRADSRLLARRPVAQLTQLTRNLQGGGPLTEAPGQMTKLDMSMKAVVNPENTQTRQVMSDSYGIQLPLINKRETKQPSPSKLMKGTTVDHLAVLPRSNRVDPQIPPPPIADRDARKGILSLMERGLIPPAAELTLDPSPVKHRVAPLHDPAEMFQPKKAGADPTLDGRFNLAQVKLDVSSNKSLDSMDTKKPEKTPQTADSRVTKTPLQVKTFEAQLQPLPPPTTPASTVNFKRSGHRFAIQNGGIRDTAPDFVAFRQHYVLSWGSIITALEHLLRLLRDFAVPLAFINGDKLADLALEFELEKAPTKENLLSVIVNWDDVEAILRRPGRRFLGPDGEHVAAAKIQAMWKRYTARSSYVSYRQRKWAAGVIAISWIMNIKMAKIRKQLKETRLYELESYRRRRKVFSDSWDRIKQSRRTIIHIPSLGYSQAVRDSVKDFGIKQNTQMSRLCDLRDPQVDVIYVSPVEMSEEMLQYYSKLLGLRPAVESGAVEDQSDMQDRYKIVVPEAFDKFPSHSMCLATHLKYSPQALQRIRNLIKGKEAYIVPGVLHKDDLAVSQILDVPILGSEPEVGHLYTTKSGSKRIFASAKVDTPPGEYDIYSLQQLHESLALLVTENLNVRRWLFKLDDEYMGRGIAYCNVIEHLNCYKWAMKEQLRYGEKWSKKWAHEPALIKIQAEIPDILDQFGVPANRKRFPTWDKFLEAFLSQGGIIEACPPSESVTTLSADMLIEPTGKIRMIANGDQIKAEGPFVSWGLSVPQSSVEPQVLNECCMRIGESCRTRGVLGYFSVDFVTFIDPKTMEQVLWATDLNLSYGDSTGMRELMLYVTSGTFDAENCVIQAPPLAKKEKKDGRRRRGDEEEQPPTPLPRYAVMSTQLLHSNLTVIHYSVFFQMCRAHGIGFDIKEKQGTVFTLLDSFKREHIGMLTVGESLQGALATFARNMSVIHQEISAPNMQGETNFKAAISDIEGILGTTIQNVEREQQEVEAQEEEEEKQQQQGLGGT